eukprot:g35473.t1
MPGNYGEFNPFSNDKLPKNWNIQFKAQPRQIVKLPKVACRCEDPKERTDFEGGYLETCTGCGYNTFHPLT